ncbi:MAG: type II toxin-antitoxin system mRNA interferase toxin, RelE/StbE family [Akkermansiaceae bacterium]
MRIDSHKSFLKAYARLSLTQRRAVDDALMRFKNDRTEESLHDHALKGKMKSLRSFAASFDLRVIYREEGGFIMVVLIDVGTHNQVY